MSLAHQVQQFNRDRKWKLFNEKVEVIDSLKILDVGVTDEEFSAADNYLEKHYPFPQMITALAISEPRLFRERYPKVNTLTYDGKRIPYADNAFDVCWSNAVIEHVGSREAQLEFMKELIRTSKKVFLTTPNRYFPIEVHTRTPLLHFLPKIIFDFYLNLIGKGWATGNYMHLLSYSDIRKLLESANVEQSYVHRNKLFGFTLDFVIVITGGQRELRH